MHFLHSFFLLFSGYLLVAFFSSLPPPLLLCPICAFAGTASTAIIAAIIKVLISMVP